jgi:hypothetical protein
MTWKVGCKNCDLIFTVQRGKVPDELALDSASVVPIKIVLQCPYCGQERDYSGTDLSRSSANEAS